MLGAPGRAGRGGGVGAPGLGSALVGGLVRKGVYLGIATGRRVRHPRFVCCNQWQLAGVTGVLVAKAR